MRAYDHETTAAPHAVPHWFDFLCPFCYVAQPRNEVLERRGLEVVHLPFQIHPEIPPGGIEAGPRNGPMYEMLEEEAARAGLPLAWPSRLPGTRTALSAAEWVRLHQPDAAAGFIKQLFAAHFALGEDIGDPRVIDRHAEASGVDVQALRAALADGSARSALARAEALGRGAGVHATPSWLIAGRLVSGLRPVSEFERLADEVLGQVAGSTSG
ncbi:MULTISPECIES: DsbA family oxidoreductase [unclassified Streptomyces]|uniref:DsbA family oxidoreductase n=1 Tax=unclassified Streptomyces TaxID=2593676 RepID=UPI0004C47EF3|nr:MULTISPECIES: DsbA family protein [unclassified Streptomyces]KOX01612.1 hypothetical protein ADL02_02050 [Streptomyces sp. NRRL WC-3723]